MRSGLHVILGILLLILFQTTLLEKVAILGIKPDLPLIAVFLIGLFWGEVKGVVSGLGLGYLMDLMSGGIWGIHLITKSVLGFLAGIMGRTLINMKVMFIGILIALCSLCQGLIFLLVSSFSTSSEGASFLLSHTVLPQALYDGILGGGLFGILYRRYFSRQNMAQEWLKSPGLSSGLGVSGPGSVEPK